MSKREIRIATRASPLALAQANIVAAAIRKQGWECSLLPMTTRGDRSPTRSTDDNYNNKDAFVAEVRQALLKQECELAVHSLKDLPSEPVPGLKLLAVTKRTEAGDVLVALKGHDWGDLAALPAGARIGTSSLRRQCLLAHKRSDLKIMDCRGNINSRLEKLKQGQYDALVLARAGLTRLGLTEYIRGELPPPQWLPAPGQGALAIECRDDFADSSPVAELLEDPHTRYCTDAERAFSQAMGGDCRAPLAAWAQWQGSGELQLHGMVAAPAGQGFMQMSCAMPHRTGQDLGRELAERMAEKGAMEILQRSQ